MPSNMKKISLLIFLSGILLSFSSTAQLIQLSETPETFIGDIQKVMAMGNNTIAIETGKKFEAHWNTRFDAAQKTQIIALCRKMAARGHKMAQYYFLFDLFEKVITKEKYNDIKLNSFISIITKSVEQYDLKTATKMLENLMDFLDKKRIYNAPFNRLYALNGTYEFQFIEKNAAQTTPTTQPNTPTTDPATATKETSAFDGWDDAPKAENLIESSKPVFDEIVTKPMPIIGGISVVLNEVDLVMATASDSVFVRKTTGTVSWKDGVWVGKGGSFTWESAGLPQISAQLKDFYFEIRNPRFSAEDVTLTYTDRLTAPIRGIFEYKSEKRAKNVAPTYPRFMSYKGEATIKNLDRNIEYHGGFSLSGRRIYSSSVENKYSNIIIKKEGKFFFKTASRRFELSDSLITSQIASFVTYIDKDSIYHSAVKLNYNSKNYILRLNKIDEGGLRDIQYTDTYHQMSIKCDAMKWNLNEGRMDFYIVSGRNQVPAIFESLDFFDNRRLTALNSSAGFNPIIMVGNFVKQKNKNTFTLNEIAEYNKRLPEHLKGGLMVAAQQGFVDYNPVTEVFQVTSKGKHYLDAFAGKKDYDDFIVPSIYGNSKDSTANATFNFQDKTITIRGVRRLNISDSLNVFVLPYDRSIKLDKNRKISFSGQFKARNYRFSGKDLVFDYEKFTLSLPKIDSITFTPQALFKKGVRKEIGGHIKFLKPGTLFLNKPDNKSGKTYLPEYPRLKIDDGVIVYFDEPTRGNRKYSRDVYFDVPKIDFDSLTIKDIEFDGTFYSGNIFKPFKEVLRIMPDTTLGFLHKVPKGVYNVFNSESSVKFSSELTMDGKGLYSQGDINHLAATLTAKEILFMADSVTAKGQLGKVVETTTKQGSYFPQVAINDYTLKWLPKVDSMIVSSKAGFNFYEGTSLLKGQIVVRTKGLFGIGVLGRSDSETASNQFQFNKEGFTADESRFNIKATASSTKSVFLGKNVDVNFNIKNSLVNIATNEGNFNDSTASTMEFPYAAYKTNINRAEWNIKDKKISMVGDVEKSVFTSTNVTQEGLAFNGKSANYEIDKMILNIGGVPFIKSADAKITPFKGDVVIRRDADMLPFKNARLTIDTLNGYHNLINGNIQILSKSKFTGDATYQFVNVRKDTFNIKMGNFELKELTMDGENIKTGKGGKLATVAMATVVERDSVFLSPKILYKGEITMLAPIKNLSLDGYVIPELKKYPKLGGYWIAYKGNKSEEIKINVDKTLKSGSSPIFAGLHFRTTTSANGLYPTFLSAKESDDDQNVFLANGLLRRDEPNKLFSIQAEGVKTLSGNKYELLDEKGIIELEGKFDLLSPKLSQYIQTAGTAQIRLDTAKHKFNTMMLVSFPVAQPLLQNMAEKIVKINLDAGINDAANNFSNPDFFVKMAQFIGDKETEEYRAKVAREYVSLFRQSPKFINTIVFSNLDLVWSPMLNAYHSIGKLGVSNIGEFDINANIDGYVEIRKNAVGSDEVYIFLDLPGENWYYLGYKEGQMGIISSDDAFNTLITAKSDKKKSKDYQLIPVDFAEALLFKKAFLETYKGIKETPKTANKKADPKNPAEAPKPTDKKDDKKKKEEEKEGF